MASRRSPAPNPGTNERRDQARPTSGARLGLGGTAWRYIHPLDAPVSTPTHQAQLHRSLVGEVAASALGAQLDVQAHLRASIGANGDVSLQDGKLRPGELTQQPRPQKKSALPSAGPSISASTNPAPTMTGPSGCAAPCPSRPLRPKARAARAAPPSSRPPKRSCRCWNSPQTRKGKPEQPPGQGELFSLPQRRMANSCPGTGGPTMAG